MAIQVTLQQAQEHLAAWLAADKAVATGQEYEIETGGTRRRLKRADAKYIQERINYWSKMVTQLTSGRSGMRTKLIVNRD